MRRSLLGWWVLALLLTAAFCSLGTWQWHRKQQKEAQLARVARVLADRVPVAWRHAYDASRARDYEWTAGAGRFVQAPAILLDNQLREGRPGVRVFRWFLPQAEQHPLLVEMGWLPVSASRTLPTTGDAPQGEQQLRGLLMPPVSGGLLHAAPQRQADGRLLVLQLDPAKIAAESGQGSAAPRVLRIDPALPIGHARDLDVLPNTLPPERHLGYAVQWFGLALAVLATAALLTYRSRRR